MSIKVMTAVWADADVSGGELVVLLAMADFAHDDGSHAFPSVPTLAQKARLSERQVQRCLRRLEEAGLIARTGVGPNGTNMYAITMSPPGDILSPGGDAHVTGGVTPMSPEPSVEPSEEEKAPLTPASGGTGDRDLLAKRADRAKAGSNRNRDRQALRALRSPKADWYAWAKEYLPDLPADLVVIAAGVERRRAPLGAEPDPEAVRRRVLYQYPKEAE